jgi:hypothetical protein
MSFFEKIYLMLVCNKFSYLSTQIILFVLVLTLDQYDTPHNEWGVAYILRVSLIMLCLLMILRFIFLNFSKVFIGMVVVISCFSVFHDEIINLLSQLDATKYVASLMVQNYSESILTIVISILVMISLIAEPK